MWGPAISGMGKSAYLRKPKLQAYPPIFSLTPKASGSTRLQSCEDKVFNSRKKKDIKQSIDHYSCYSSSSNPDLYNGSDHICQRKQQKSESVWL